MKVLSVMLMFGFLSASGVVETDRQAARHDVQVDILEQWLEGGIVAGDVVELLPETVRHEATSVPDRAIELCRRLLAKTRIPMYIADSDPNGKVEYVQGCRKVQRALAVLRLIKTQKARDIENAVVGLVFGTFGAGSLYRWPDALTGAAKQGLILDAESLAVLGRQEPDVLAEITGNIGAARLPLQRSILLSLVLSEHADREHLIRAFADDCNDVSMKQYAEQLLSRVRRNLPEERYNKSSVGELLKSYLATLPEMKKEFSSAHLELFFTPGSMPPELTQWTLLHMGRSEFSTQRDAIARNAGNALDLMTVGQSKTIVFTAPDGRLMAQVYGKERMLFEAYKDHLEQWRISSGTPGE